MEALAPCRTVEFCWSAKRRELQSGSSPHAESPKGSERGPRIRVRGRLQEMIRAELFNLEKAEAVLRCLALSMDSMSLGEAPYYPNVVEVAGDLVKRSIVDLDVLYDGYIPNPVMAAGKIERW